MSIVENDRSKCSGCMACVAVCPKRCIESVRDEEGFDYPVVDTSQCVNCGLCERVCPNSGKEQSGDSMKETYAVYARDEEIRRNSSSGGVFSLLATKILEEGGVVFGAAMSQDCSAVLHIAIENQAGLAKLRGSKYVQSQIGDAYVKVRANLEAGRKVLFSGTPCQINGLASYLGEEYEDLILVDIICHGVPSPLIWEKYVREWEKKYKRKITAVNFRFKPSGSWHGFGIGKWSVRRRYFAERNWDPYMRLFLRDTILRPSCYQCNAKQTKQADLTLGDFWGIEKIAPHMDDGKGTSVVILRSEKGKRLFQDISNAVLCEKVSYEDAVKDNWAEYRSVPRPDGRIALFTDIDRLSVRQLRNRYCPIERYEIKMAILKKWHWYKDG